MSEDRDRNTDWSDAFGGSQDEPTKKNDAAPAHRDRSVEERALKRAGDLRFLHVLLHEISHDDPAARERRVAGVMATIDREAAATEPLPSAGAFVPSGFNHNGWWITSLSAVAALLLLAVVAYWSTLPAPTAQAAMRTAIERAAQPRDHQYRIWTILRSASGTILQCEGMLYLRGGKLFAIRHPGPRGDVWIGSNGRSEWFLPIDDKPVMSERPNFALRLVHIDGVGLPNLRLNELLSYFEVHYTLELLSDERIASDSGVRYRHIRGARRDVVGDGPEMVDIWVDPTTGNAQKLVLDWQHASDHVGLLHATIEWMGDDAMPDEWYEPTSHHSMPLIFAKPPKNLSSGDVRPADNAP